VLCQHRVDAGHLNERVLVAVPLIGARSRRAEGLGWHTSFEWQPTDDGQFAIAEFVASDPKVIAEIVRAAGS
jgi:hypothetical protein